MCRAVSQALNWTVTVTEYSATVALAATVTVTVIDHESNCHDPLPSPSWSDWADACLRQSAKSKTENSVFLSKPPDAVPGMDALTLPSASRGASLGLASGSRDVEVSMSPGALQHRRLEYQTDWFQGVVAFLEGGDVAALGALSRDWRAAPAVLARALRRVAFADVCAAQMPPPESMLHLHHMDLQRFSNQVYASQLGVGWLRRFAADRKAIARLASLRVGQLVPVSLRATLVRSCVSLTTLSLDGCQSVDDGVLALVRAPGLRVIDLSGCWRVTDAGLAALAQRCPRIEKALLGHLNRITTAGIEAIATAWPALHTLALCGESRLVSAASVAALVELPALERLRIQGLHLHEDGWRHVLRAAASRVARANVVVSIAGSPLAEAECLVTRTCGAPLRQLVFLGSHGATPAVVSSFLRDTLRALAELPAKAAVGRVCEGTAATPTGSPSPSEAGGVACGLDWDIVAAPQCPSAGRHGEVPPCVVPAPSGERIRVTVVAPLSVSLSGTCAVSAEPGDDVCDCAVFPCAGFTSLRV